MIVTDGETLFDRFDPWVDSLIHATICYWPAAIMYLLSHCAIKSIYDLLSHFSFLLPSRFFVLYERSNIDVIEHAVCGEHAPMRHVAHT